MQQRLHKALANLGLASRRTIEQWIIDGKITVNHQVAKIGAQVTANDLIKVNGKIVRLPSQQQESKVIIYNKPIGEVCSANDELGRRTVFNNLPPIKNAKWISIGRLDLNSSGLLLFTTDGALAHKLMHPSANIEREYLVRVLGEVTNNIINKLKRGVICDGEKLTFKAIKKNNTSNNNDKANSWYKVTLIEGKNREIRRAFESQGIKVSRLIRIRFGNIHLPKTLLPGQWREINAKGL